ncbi:type II toxin-antitoxin system TacA family antitoxin [Mycolicibacterium gilvum]|uniref:type II toxin-antitoxin system TacA family antitoxin n=1 Tax=Mycolicibacterium gilvum TaxID=1804 RepID=UPI004046193B
MDPMAAKSERFAVRLTAEQDALIRRAADVEGTDLTNFTLTATLAHAREVLADRRLFMLGEQAWSEFLSVLDRPVSPKPRLATLFAEPSIFDE